MLIHCMCVTKAQYMAVYPDLQTTTCSIVMRTDVVYSHRLEATTVMQSFSVINIAISYR